MESNKIITLDSSSAEELLDLIDLAQTKILPQLKEVLQKAEKLERSINKAGKSLFEGAKEIDAANKKDNALENQIHKFIEQFLEATGSLREMGDNGIIAQKRSEEVLKRLELLDLDFVEEITKISFEDLTKKVLSAQRNFFHNQKISSAFLIGCGVGLFVLGTVFGAAFTGYLGGWHYG